MGIMELQLHANKFHITILQRHILRHFWACSLMHKISTHKMTGKQY